MTQLTDEQRAIIEETITNKPGKYGIQAVAGSGKSFTIFKAIDYIKEHEPNAKILYIVFNKANQLEAQHKLTKYAGWAQPVEVKTAHSFAYNKWLSVIGQFTALNNFDWDIISKVKSSYKDPEIRFSKRAPFTWLHDKFCASKCGIKTFLEDMREHFNDEYEGPDKAKDCDIIGPYGKKHKKFGIQVDGYSYVSRAHIDAFEEVYKAHTDAGCYTHSMYLKSAAYSKSTGGSHYDYVFFDEAQDASYFMLKLLEKQDISKIYFVGDERQSIYRFDGSSENVFETTNFDKSYTLSTSFRFGKDIAKLATSIIQMNTGQTVNGTKQDHPTTENISARLYRTNAGLFEDSLDIAFYSKIRGQRVKIDLKKGEYDESAHVEILSFLKLYYMYMRPESYRKYSHYFPMYLSASLTAFEKDLKNKVRFLDAYNDHYDNLSDDIHSIFIYVQKNENFIEKFDAMRSCLSEINPEKTIVMVTMHRSKGLEWDNVTIAEPTKLYFKDKEGVIRRNINFMQELNLAYVACTRARKNLNASVLYDELSRENPRFNKKYLTIFEGVAADGMIPIDESLNKEPEETKVTCEV